MSAIAAASPLAQRLSDPVIQAWVELRFAKTPLSFGALVLAVCERCGPVRAGHLWCQLKHWLSAGFVEARGHPVHYAMADTAKAHSSPPPAPVRRAPRHWTERRTPRQRLWSAMRVLKRFDLVQLRIAADVTEANAKNFLRIMTRAGYCHITPAAMSGHLSWALGPRHCGPLPPAVHYLRGPCTSIMRVTDRNDGTIVDVPQRLHWPARSESQPLAGGEG